MIKKLQLITLILFLSNYSYSQSTENVLFIGNSMTYFNNMPTLFQNIANDKGKNVAIQTHTPGGTGFVDHYTNPTVYNLFKNNIWDIVVLQPGTSESAGVSWPVNTTVERGQKMIDSIRKYSPCAKIFLYQIPYGIKATNNIPDYNDYFARQTMIKDSITKMADNLHIPFVPAGESARMHYTAQQDLLLHSTYNDVHPNLNGSYLVATNMFTTIYQEPVTGTSSFGGLTQTAAEYFHNITDQIVLPNKPDWRINTYNLHADFNYVVNNLEVSFTNLASNYSSLEWNFGDGTISSVENPIHTFSSNGTKTVTLKATLNGCEETITIQIQLGSLQSELFTKKTVLIYPNPARNDINISSTNSFQLKIINAFGQVVYTTKNTKKEWKIDISNFQSGIYFVLSDNEVKCKFIKY